MLFAVEKAAGEFSMTWLDLAKGGIGGVFLGLLIWLVVFQIPSMHKDLMAAEARFTEAVTKLMTGYRLDQEAARDAFRREQDAMRKAHMAQCDAATNSFETALREICNRAERSDERFTQLLREVMTSQEKVAT